MEERKSNKIGIVLLVLILIIGAAIGGWFIGYKGLIIKHPELKCPKECPVVEENKEEQQEEIIQYAEGDIYNIEFFVSELNKELASQEPLTISWPEYQTAKAIYDNDNKEIDLVITDEYGTTTETIYVKEFIYNGKKYYSLVYESYPEESTYDLYQIMDFYTDLYAKNQGKEYLRDKVQGVPTGPIYYYEYVLQDIETAKKFNTKEEQDAYEVENINQPTIEKNYYEVGGKKAFKDIMVIPLHENTYNELAKQFE